MYISIPSLVFLAGFATIGLGAPTSDTGIFQRNPQALSCTPNNQGAEICCDQFGGCVPRNQLDPAFEDRIITKREPQALSCTPNNQGAEICCDQFGGCVPRNQLDPVFEDRIIN